MTSDASRVEQTTAERIVEAATQEFFEFGYHGASLRRLADHAGIRSATLYYHFGSKQDLLVAIMRGTLNELIVRVGVATGSTTEPVEQLANAVRTHIQYHVERFREVFLCDAELRALDIEARDTIIGLRDGYEAIFREILRRGEAQGVLDVPDVGLVTRSLLASCTGVAFWFRPTGPLSLDNVTDTYVSLFLRALGARPAVLDG